MSGNAFFRASVSLVGGILLGGVVGALLAMLFSPFWPVALLAVPALIGALSIQAGALPSLGSMTGMARLVRGLVTTEPRFIGWAFLAGFLSGATFTGLTVASEIGGT